MTWLIFLFCANFEVFCNEYIQLNVLTIDKFNTFNSHNNTLVECILICLFIIFINTQIETLYSFSKAAWLISESYQQKVNILMGLESTDIVELVRQKHSGTGEIKFWFHGPYSILIFILLIFSCIESQLCHAGSFIPAHGLSSHRAWAQLFHSMWDLSSPTRDQTCISCIARQILNHWTTREVPILLKPHFRPLIEILLHMFDIIIFLKRRCGSVIVSYPSYTASLTTGQDLSTPVWHTGLCMS